MYIIQKKGSKKHKNRAACFNAHGGAAIVQTAKSSMHNCVKWAFANDIVVVNVEYRLAPENRSPAGAKDMIAAIDYFKENAE